MIGETRTPRPRIVTWERFCRAPERPAAAIRGVPAAIEESDTPDRAAESIAFLCSGRRAQFRAGSKVSVRGDRTDGIARTVDGGPLNSLLPVSAAGRLGRFGEAEFPHG